MAMNPPLNPVDEALRFRDQVYRAGSAVHRWRGSPDDHADRQARRDALDQRHAHRYAQYGCGDPDTPHQRPCRMLDRGQRPLREASRHIDSIQHPGSRWERARNAIGRANRRDDALMDMAERFFTEAERTANSYSDLCLARTSGSGRSHRRRYFDDSNACGPCPRSGRTAQAQESYRAGPSRGTRHRQDGHGDRRVRCETRQQHTVLYEEYGGFDREVDEFFGHYEREVSFAVIFG